MSSRTSPGLFVVALVIFGLGCVTTSAANLIPNGDFSAGNTGFTSDYVNGTSGQGVYELTTDPHIHHSTAISFHDHTTGSGLFYIADGATTANKVAWRTTVSVDPNTPYAFSGWKSSWGNDGTGHDPSPANLQASINGTPIGSTVAPSTDGVWAPFTMAVWNSGSATSATLTIVDQNIASFGNDFALDDLSFASSVPEPVSLSLVTIGALVTVLTRCRHA